MLNEKHLEEMLEYAQAHGLDEMGVRMDLYLVMGPKKVKLCAIEGDPALLKATFDGMAPKFEEAKKGLQKVLEEMNEITPAVKAP